MLIRLLILGAYLRGSKLQNESKAQLNLDMKEKLRNETLEEKLIPSFSVGCRRLTPGAEHLEARFPRVHDQHTVEHLLTNDYRL